MGEGGTQQALLGSGGRDPGSLPTPGQGGWVPSPLVLNEIRLYQRTWYPCLSTLSSDHEDPPLTLSSPEDDGPPTVAQIKKGIGA